MGLLRAVQIVHYLFLRRGGGSKQINSIDYHLKRGGGLGGITLKKSGMVLVSETLKDKQQKNKAA